MKPSGLFISSVNTNSGKTWVTRSLVQNLIAKKIREMNIRAIKPIQSGFSNPNELESDAQQLAIAQSNYDIQPADICLHSFRAAIAPNLAARLEKKHYDLDSCVQFCHHQMKQGFCLIEGAGGLFSPISDDALNWQLASSLNLPVLLVIKDELGILSQTIATAIAAKNLGINLLAIVVNGFEANSQRQTDVELKRIIKDTPILAISQNANHSEEQAMAKHIEKLILQLR